MGTSATLLCSGSPSLHRSLGFYLSRSPASNIHLCSRVLSQKFLRRAAFHKSCHGVWELETNSPRGIVLCHRHSLTSTRLTSKHSRVDEGHENVVDHPHPREDETVYPGEGRE